MICSNHLNTATGGIEDCLHRNERRTWQVIALTLSMMIVEISAGTIFGSMALLADGWHMGTHAAALGITALAYVLSRRNAANPLFSFGPGKIGVLGGYTSAIVLALVAFLMTVPTEAEPPAAILPLAAEPVDEHHRWAVAAVILEVDRTIEIEEFTRRHTVKVADSIRDGIPVTRR